MTAEPLIEKAIHRAIIKTWHTAKRKGENANAVAVAAAKEVMDLLRQEEDERTVKAGAVLASTIRYSDGTYGREYEEQSVSPQPASMVDKALETAAEILCNFKTEGKRTKLEELEAAYAMLFTQLNRVCAGKAAEQPEKLYQGSMYEITEIIRVARDNPEGPRDFWAIDIPEGATGVNVYNKNNELIASFDAKGNRLDDGSSQ